MGYGSRSISDWCEEVHANARAHGFFDGKLVKRADGREVARPDTIPERLALIHSEVSEALEAYRDDAMEMRIGPNGKPEGFPVEIADTVIRCFDLAESLGIDLEKAIREKHAFNLTRPVGHGRVRL